MKTLTETMIKYKLNQGTGFCIIGAEPPPFFIIFEGLSFGEKSSRYKL